jgi:hypothetical protein
MKVAITGHSAGIGRSFSDQMTALGHEIVGISKRDGNNIRIIPKIVKLIEPCDLWINNAQAGYAQTELLYKVWESWKNLPHKQIWIISTMLTTDHRLVKIPGMTEVSMAEYKNQKRALEDAFYQLKTAAFSPQMILIRPGAVATQPDQIPNEHGADVNTWVKTVLDFYYQAQKNNLWIEEISLGFRKQKSKND